MLPSLIVGRASDYDGHHLKLFTLVGWGRSFLSVAWPNRGLPGVSSLFCSGFSASYWAPRDLHRRAAYSICESSFLIHHSGYSDLCVCP